MSNLDYDPGDSDVVLDIVIPWAEANGLRPTWIPADDVFVEGDVIRFREIVPAEEVGPDQYPKEDEWASVVVGEWQTVPLIVHPSLFGLGLTDESGRSA